MTLNDIGPVDASVEFIFFLSNMMDRIEPSQVEKVSGAARDARLMQSLAAGDRTALAELMRHHQQRVLSTAFRFLRSWDAAEDVTQETFLKVFRSAAKYEPRAAFTTWLYRVVVNLCWDRRRAFVRELRVRGTVRRAEVEVGRAEMEAEERDEQIAQAVESLPDRQRLAVLLHCFDGLSHQDIAEITGWSAKAVGSCLVRAYASLRKSLRQHLP